MDALEKRIGYRFRNRDLLSLALTHPSLANAQSNQRLEFLGDAVLGLAVGHLLYDMYPQEQEGDLARRQAALVRGETLSDMARELGLGEVIRMAPGEAKAGGREKDSNLEDAMEALIGAVYLDGGIAEAEKFIRTFWHSRAEKMQAAPKDAKTALQEWAQARGLPVPAYVLVDTTGSAHAPVFTIEVFIHGHAPERASAPSKRVAEQTAAFALLTHLEKEGEK